MNKKVLFITQAAVIAALYVVLTYVAALLRLSSGAIQVRFSEALTILPYFIPSAIPGVTIGCFLANLLTGGAVLDIVFGSIATLIGCVGSYLLYLMLTVGAGEVISCYILGMILLFALDKHKKAIFR